jgi:hypothetical protein
MEPIYYYPSSLPPDQVVRMEEKMPDYNLAFMIEAHDGFYWWFEHKETGQTINIPAMINKNPEALAKMKDMLRKSERKGIL